MRLEDVATGEPLLTFPELEGQTWPVVFSPDGRLLVSSNNTGRAPGKGDPPGTTPYSMRLWEAATAAEVLSLPGLTGEHAAFAANGRLLALAVPPQEILVWDLAAGRELQRFRGFNAEVTWLAFSPDGRRLVSGLGDSTLLVWEVRSGGAAPKPGPGFKGWDKAWADLAGADAARAFRARWALVSSPREAVAFLKEHLHPAQPADADRVRRLLADLGSERFGVRDKAQAELEALGDLAETALRQALAGGPTLEVRRRVQRALERLRGPVTRPETRRALRALAALEDIATPAARSLLETLATGAGAARLTREARAALVRLNRKALVQR